MKSKSLVTIGIPTYNRSSALVKAIESAIAQTYSNIEIVISDNGSTDETESLCQHYQLKDDRIIYIKQPLNIGATDNFNYLLGVAKGELFMWLADDDWLDEDYVDKCVSCIQSQLGYSLVAGSCSFYSHGKLFSDSVHTNVEQDYSQERTVSYYRQVEDNSCFYGVMNTSDLRRLGGVKNVMGGDLLLISGIAYLGKIKTIPNTNIHRELGGASENQATVVSAYNLPKYWAMIPGIYLIYISWQVFQDILSMQTIYKNLTISTRCMFAIRTASVVLGKIFKLYGSVSRKYISKSLKRMSL
jgi:glycosyltransferase involved in cell wall biosynthesis